MKNLLYMSNLKLISKIFISVIAVFAISSASLYAQDKSMRLTGIVYDENKQPMPGVGVLVVGSLKISNPYSYAEAALMNAVAVKPNTSYAITLWTKRLSATSATSYINISCNHEAYVATVYVDDIVITQNP